MFQKHELLCHPLDIIEEAHQVVTDPKRQRTSHHLHRKSESIRVFSRVHVGGSLGCFGFTCIRSMMVVRFLSWVGPRNFNTRFIMVMLLHSINSSSSSWPLRTSRSFNNSATCQGSIFFFILNETIAEHKNIISFNSLYCHMHDRLCLGFDMTKSFTK